jgi:hypothetical protein
MDKILNILLVFRSGGDFEMRDVLLLANQLQKKKGTFCIDTYCLTNIVKNEFPISNVTLLPMQYLWRGWWSKMNLFSPELEYLRPYLYLDLDTALIKPVSCVLLNDLTQSNVIMLRDFYKRGKAASGVMWIPAKNEKIQRVWNEWIKDPDGIMKKYRGDQEFINSIISPDHYWQDVTNGITTFKPNRKIRKELNGKESIVCFHGRPRIHKAAKTVTWVNKYVKGEL